MELSRITSSQHPNPRKNEGSPHRAHDEGLPRAWKSSRWSNFPTRAPPRTATPPRSPRAEPSTNERHPPLAEFGRVASRLAPPAWRSRARGRASPRPTLTEATRYTRPSTPPFPRVRAGRTSPPRAPVIFPPKLRHRETTTKTANQDETSVSPRPRPARSHRFDIGTSSPCPPPPNAICLTIPYEARRREEILGGRARSGAIVVAVALVFVVRRRPRGANPVFLKVGSIVSRGCGALGAADTAARALNTQSIGGDRRRDGREVRVDRRRSRQTAGGATFKDSTDYEYDHRSRRCATCGTRGCGPCTACRRRTTPARRDDRPARRRRHSDAL